MIERETHKEILKQDYEKQREAADSLRERGEAEKAAQHYRKAASILEKMAELEQEGPLSEKRRELAENLRNGADKLTSSGWSPQDDNIDDSQSKRGTKTAEGGDFKEEADATNYLQEPPPMDFDDVGGMTDLKQTLKDKVIDPLERSDLYEEYELGVVNGILLYGPPGTGKTYVTRALAGKLDYNFIEITPTDITSSLVGEAADNVAELFEIARNNQPCIIFIDEIDAVAGKRSGGASKTQSERQMVNQLLTELNEIQDEEVVVVAATNRMEDVDDAIKRSGRFDERIEIPLPDDKARAAILRVHLRERPVLSDEIDWDIVKAKTQGYSASDMELIATNAARKALQEAQEEGEIRKISQRHINKAIQETEPSV